MIRQPIRNAATRLRCIAIPLQFIACVLDPGRYEDQKTVQYTEAMKRPLRLYPAACVAAFLFPVIAFADLTQTSTLSLSGQTNINFDTGALGNSGGDLQYSSTGLTPQGSATALNAMIYATAAKLNDLTLLEVSLYPGYSKAELPSTILGVNDLFYVHTNGGHYAAALVTAVTGTSITIMFRTFNVTGGTGGTGGSTAPAVTAIRNNSSGIAAGVPSYGIAPSSIFVIQGTALADAGTPLLQDSSGGLPLTLNGASIAVTVAGVTVHPAIYYTSPTQIAAVLPAATPAGTGTLTVTYNGTVSNTQAIVVVPAALGINTYYTNSAVATDGTTYALLSYTNSGTPGENIVLWTTGLGADASDSDTTYTTTPHAVNTPLQIYIGGIPATILYQGSAGYPGVDQINVTIPQSAPDGCWISVAAVANGVLSNVTTIPINSGGGVCIDPVNGLTGAEIAPGGTQTLRTGVVAITQTNKAVTSGTPTYSTNADAAFETYTGLYSPANPVSPGSCIVVYTTTASTGIGSGLDAGVLNLSGTGGVAVTLPIQLGIKGAYYTSLANGAIPQTGGNFTFTGNGGADVGSFTLALNFANPLFQWNNPSVAASVDRSKGFTVTWNGGNPDSYVFVTGTATASGTTVGFTCMAKDGDGQFAVPSYILSALPAGTGGVGVQNDFYEKLNPSGLDIGIGIGEIGISTTSAFK